MSTLLSNTPTLMSDGTKPMLVSIEGEANSSTKYIYYGFGLTTPTAFHVYNSILNQPLVVGTDYGKLWLYTDAPNVYINMTTGV